MLSKYDQRHPSFEDPLGSFHSNLTANIGLSRWSPAGVEHHDGPDTARIREHRLYEVAHLECKQDLQRD